MFSSLQESLNEVDKKSSNRQKMSIAAHDASAQMEQRSLQHLQQAALAEPGPRTVLHALVEVGAELVAERSILSTDPDSGAVHDT